MNNNYMYMNYDPRQHPCKDCKERHAFCHGHCAEEKAFNESKPPKPTSTYCDRGKMRDIFHKKGRVIRNG